MAELTTQERLQPSLLDRLTDNDPESRQESRDQRVLSVPRLREAVLRDLSWLLNATHLAADQDLTDFPDSEKSVVNYGIPDLTGVPVSSINVTELERRIQQAIATFEPRILGKSLRVTVLARDDQMNRNAVSFLIEGDLWAQPVPMALYLKTDLDLDSGHFTVRETG